MIYPNSTLAHISPWQVPLSGSQKPCDGLLAVTDSLGQCVWGQVFEVGIGNPSFRRRLTGKLSRFASRLASSPAGLAGLSVSPSSMRLCRTSGLSVSQP